MLKITHFEITIDGKTYQTNNLEEVKPDQDTQWLMMGLYRPSTYTGMYKADEIISDRDKAFLDRVKALKSTFSRVYPNAILKQVACSLGDSSEWKFMLESPKEYHIEWARSAYNCGLIDTYIPDYQPK